MKLSENVDKKLQDLIVLWADEYMIGKPEILIAGVYHNVKKFLEDKTENINKTFKPKQN